MARVCRKREENHPNRRAAAATEWPPNPACGVPVGEFGVAVSLVSTEDFETGLSWAPCGHRSKQAGLAKPGQASVAAIREKLSNVSVSVCGGEERHQTT